MSSSDRRALIIGISKYNYSGAPTLQGVPYDVESATKIALAMGIPKENITYLRDSQATKANILNTLKDFSSKTREGTRAFVYFSGHGSREPDPNTNQCIDGLLPADGQPITSKEFTDASQKLATSADKVITIVDACHAAGVIESHANTRSMMSTGNLNAKFFSKVAAGNNRCKVHVNDSSTRGMLEDFTRVGGLKENFVQITSAKPNEVSWDESDKGGIATQALRDCLLGKAKDIDGSGGVSMSEIQQCAQGIMNEKLKTNAIYGKYPSTITITGNRNILPVSTRPNSPATTVSTSQPVKIPASVTVAQVTQPVKPEPVKPEPVKPEPIKPEPIKPEPIKPEPIKPEPIKPEPIKPPQVVTTVKPQTNLILPEASEALSENEVIISPSLASRATLEDIYHQRNPKKIVKVSLNKQQFKIGKDSLQIKIESNRDGYAYLVMLGSDTKSFYILFPNGHDGQNKIQANKPLILPRPNWSMSVNGPEGTDHLLILVTETPRTFDGVIIEPPGSANPFTFSLNNLKGRAELINYLVGNKSKGFVGNFGAELISIKEVN
jgi:hypothetical protein